LAFKKALKTKFPALKTACFCFKKAFKQDFVEGFFNG